MSEKINNILHRFFAFVVRRKLLCVLLVVLCCSLFAAKVSISAQNIGAGEAVSKISKAITMGSLAPITGPGEKNESSVDTDNTTENTSSSTPLSVGKSNSTTGITSSSNTSSTTPPNSSSGSSGSNPSSPALPVDETPSAVVAFYADNQSDTDAEDENHLRVVDYILATGANPVFHAGDLMEDGTQDSLNRFNAVTGTMRSSRSFYAALGNNDRKYGDSSTPSSLFLNNFVFPNNEQWYSVNVGNLHMVVLDSAFSRSSTTQRNWLIADLQSASSQSKVTGVMYHHPDFSADISQYLTDNGFDFVISGHTHSYTHAISGGVHYFVTSGQPGIGYLLARIYQDNVSISYYNSSNSVVETFNFNER